MLRSLHFYGAHIGSFQPNLINDRIGIGYAGIIVGKRVQDWAFDATYYMSNQDGITTQGC